MNSCTHKLALNKFIAIILFTCVFYGTQGLAELRLNSSSVWLGNLINHSLLQSTLAQSLVVIRNKRGRIYVFEYRARKGEKLSRIAKRYKVKISDLIIINRIAAPYRMKSSQRLKIPWRGQKIPKYDRKRVSFRVIGKINTRKKVPKSKNQSKLKVGSKGRTEKQLLNRKSSITAITNRDFALEIRPSAFRKKWQLSWVWPALGQLSKQYTNQNKAIEISGNFGQSVYAAAKGEVVYTGSSLFSFGNLIIIKHRNKLFTTYAHNSQVFVRQGQTVVAGQKIAEMGQNNLQMSLLRFEIRLGGKSINPLKILPDKAVN